VKKYALIVAVLLLVVTGFWFVIPDRFIIDLIESSISGEEISLKIEGFRKGLFYSFDAEKLSILKRGTPGNKATSESQPDSPPTSESPLLILDGVHGTIMIPSVLRLNPQLSLDSHLHGGTVTGTIGLTVKGPVRLKGSDIPVKGLPVLDLIGLQGEGTLSGYLHLRDGAGELRLIVDNAQFRNASIGGFFLPLEIFSQIKSLISIKGTAIEVQSFSLQGKGVYARIKGRAVGKSLNLTLELMTDSSFQSGAVLMALLDQYKVSPGYYVIPFKTSL
jgi:type II secretion system protein N